MWPEEQQLTAQHTEQRSTDRRTYASRPCRSLLQPTAVLYLLGVLLFPLSTRAIPQTAPGVLIPKLALALQPTAVLTLVERIGAATVLPKM